MTARADATLAAIVQELAKDGWPELPLFRLAAVADFCGIHRMVADMRLCRAGYAVYTDLRGYRSLTPAGMAAVKAARSKPRADSQSAPCGGQSHGVALDTRQDASGAADHSRTADRRVTQEAFTTTTQRDEALAQRIRNNTS